MDNGNQGDGPMECGPGSEPCQPEPKRRREDRRTGRMDVCLHFFCRSNYQGAYRHIFSYVTTNRDAISLSRTCRNLYSAFDVMMNRSSMMRHRLRYANRDPRGCICVSPFGLDTRFYVDSLEAYKENLVKNHDMELAINVLKKSKVRTMISGSRALEALLKSESSAEHAKLIHKFHAMKKTRFGKDTDYHPEMNSESIVAGTKLVHELNVMVSDMYGKGYERVSQPHPSTAQELFSSSYQNHWMLHPHVVWPAAGPTDTSDIDIFILSEGRNGGGGNEKGWEEVEKLEEASAIASMDTLLVEFVEALGGVYRIDTIDFACCMMESLEETIECQILSISYAPGIVNIFCKDGVHFQIIAWAGAETPSDTFSSFDMPCCEIGYIPKDDKVVSSPAFRVAVTTRVNVMGNLRMQWRRAQKYYDRFAIGSTRSVTGPAGKTTPHQLVRYHTIPPFRLDTTLVHAVFKTEHDADYDFHMIECERRITKEEAENPHPRRPFGCFRPRKSMGAWGIIPREGTHGEKMRYVYGGVGPHALSEYGNSMCIY